jgi:hypothetical protein
MTKRGRAGGIGLARILTIGGVGLLPACADLGDPVRPPVTGSPEIALLIPARTVAGDTVRVRGSGFGSTEGAVEFAGPGRAAAPVLEWNDEEIAVLVPASAEGGDLVVRHAGGGSSAPIPFSVAPVPVTYADLVPLLHTWGCSSCHGGQNDLWVEPYSELLGGTSFHGPVVIPRRSDESLLVRVLGPDAMPEGIERMPLGGAYLSPEQVLVFADFVDQGALPAPLGPSPDPGARHVPLGSPTAAPAGDPAGD